MRLWRVKVWPLRVMLYIMPITLSIVAVSVMRTLPSPKRMTLPFSLFIIL